MVASAVTSTTSLPIVGGPSRRSAAFLLPASRPVRNRRETTKERRIDARPHCTAIPSPGAFAHFRSRYETEKVPVGGLKIEVPPVDYPLEPMVGFPSTCKRLALPATPAFGLNE